MTRNRTGSLTAATWLIGLGIVFLVQRAADLPWSQAWPMFLILIGVASFVTTILHGRYVYGGLWAFTWPVAWIVVGSLLLASTTGRIGTEPGQLIADYWPWALVILGVWFVIGAFVPSGRGLTETLQLPLGGASEARRPDRLRGRQPGGRLGGPWTARRRPVRGRRHPQDDGHGRRRADPGHAATG